MECTIERDALHRFLSQAKAAVYKRGPLFGRALIECNGGSVAVSTTDAEVWLKQHNPASVSVSGAVVVDVEEAYRAVHRLPPRSPVTLRAEAERVEICSGTSRFKLLGLDPQEFQILPVSCREKSQHTIVLSGTVLQEMVERTLFAASKDREYLRLCGVFTEVPKEGVLRMVASDGYRLAMAEREVKVADPSTWPKAILPRKGLAVAQKLLASTKGDVSLSVQESYAFLVAGGFSLTMGLIEEKFPEYQAVIPQQTSCTVRCVPGDLLGALRRVLTVAGEMHLVKLAMGEGRIRVSNGDGDVEAMEEVEAWCDRGEIEMWFNGTYLIDALKAVGKKRTVVIGITDKEGPITVEGDGDPSYLSVVMPMRM